MGVYKRLEDVPTEQRLEQYADCYEGRDIWNDWAEQATASNGERYEMYVERTERSWKSHMTERGRHHALARPADVEAWSESILDRCKPLSAYQIYFTKLEAFYTWLQFHTGHPHLYHPVWMAAANFDATATIWDAKIARRDA
jgi:hypothetical protein